MQMRWADGRPNLFSVRVARDYREALTAGWSDTDIMTGQLWVGEIVASGLRFECSNP